MMIAISFSRGGIELPNRTKAPTRWTRSHSSGLRSSALKGPRRPVPRGPDWIASATRFWSAVIVSGVSVVNLGSLMTFLPDCFGTSVGEAEGPMPPRSSHPSPPSGGQLVSVRRCGHLERVDDAREEREVVRGRRQLDHPLLVVPLLQRVERRLIDAVRAHELTYVRDDVALLVAKLARVTLRA